MQEATKVKKDKIIAIIPARGGSKGIPEKNIKDLLGKPLIAYTIEAALKCEDLDRIIVSTDDEKIAKIARKYGAEVPFMRPKELAEDDIPAIPYVIRHAVKELKRSENFNVDIIAMLQPTSPLRGTKYINSAIEKLIDTKCDWAVTVSKASPHPFRMKRMKEDKLVPLFEAEDIWVQRQDFPPIYHLNGAVYVTWRNVIMEKEVFQDKDWRGIIMEEEDAIDIDTLTDFLVAESILKRKKERK
ncbi:MAG: acylneuraminate cytidylyltransferase family protein [Candidatus Omnitrophica bacterium]|nr:acylneuraminate cytidylyltransferase family protein [Candidatus Omnitrophota bacterium]